MSLTIDYIISFKTHPDVQKLDKQTIDHINTLSLNNDKRYKYSRNVQIYPPYNNQLLKNPKLQNMKDIIENRINLILNKLSENNINNLLLEFVNNIGHISEQDYINVQKTFYLKMMSEINFVNIYLKFLININCIYARVYSYSLEFFINTLESKFNYDYNNGIEYNTDYINKLNNETKRINNLLIIKDAIKLKILGNNIYDDCSNILLNQKKFLPDIYYWFNDDFNVKYTNKVKELLQTENIQTRDKVLLENLFSVKSTKIYIPTPNIVINKDTLLLEINNILDEYILMENIDDVIYFIENKCTDAVKKNKFCLCLIENYFIGLNDKLINLIKSLCNGSLIFSTNIKTSIALHKKKCNNNDNKYIIFNGL